MKLGVSPSGLNWLARFRQRLIVPPDWMREYGESGLGWFLAAERDLKKNGIVVPGTLIQANLQLFEPGEFDHPGELLFSLSELTSGKMLREVADQLYHLKGEHSADPEESFFSRYLGDELERVQGVKVSRRLCPVDQLYVSTTIFFRAHLPDGIVRRTVYPVLVSPVSLVAMVLPQKYWSKAGWESYEAFD